MAAEVLQETCRVLGNETLGFWIQTGAFIISAVAALLLLRHSTAKARQRATIELALYEIQNTTLTEAKHHVSKLHDANTNFTALACEFSSDKPENQSILKVLNNYEFIAAGIKEGAFDEEIFKRMKRSIVVRDWEALEVYIKELRRTRNRDKLFIEFEWLACRWKKCVIKPEVSWLRRIRLPS